MHHKLIRRRTTNILFTAIYLSATIFAHEAMNFKTHSNQITYQKCHDSLQLNFQPFPLDYQPQHHPCNPTIAETFILTIPNGCVYGADGVIITDDQIVTKLLWPNDFKQKALLEKLDLTTLPKLTKIQGKVAVITQSGSGCFYHWLAEILGRLALLELHKIQYDYLYVPLTKPYMRESLELWGVDMSKIIEPSDELKYIQADELIVPSLVNRVQPDLISNLASYPAIWVIDYLRQKFLPHIKTLDTNQQNFAKKIFISRNDATIRKFNNEDDLFEKLQTHGFIRYYLSKLSFLEQVALFAQADIIIAPHGAGLAHLMFAQPETQVIELFQARPDATYWYLSQSQDLNLNHTCIQTCSFDQTDEGHFNTNIPQSAIDQILTIVCALKKEESF